MLIAIDRDSREVRVAVARQRGGSDAVDEVFSFELPAPSEAGTPGSQIEGIVQELVARRLGRADMLLALGRSAVEMRRLSVPPAPDSELPELVRFQAMRQFSGMTDEWTVDYLTLDSQTEGPREVLAAAVSPDVAQVVRDNCEHAKINLHRLVLRSCATASIVSRSPQVDTRGQVLQVVNVFAAEADLTLVDDDRAVMMRTVRLSESGKVDALLSEIRRTLSAAPNQLPGKTVSQIVVLGTESEHAVLRDSLQELSVPVTYLDPFEAISTGRSLKQRPSHPGRYAPLLGMLANEMAGVDHGIDFLAPRKTADAPSKKRQYVLAGVTAAAVVLGLGGYVWMQLDELNHKIAQLEQTLNELNENSDIVKRQRDEAKMLDDWVKGDVHWLDELHRMANRFPSAEDVRLTNMELRTGVDGGGIMRLQGYVKDHDVISDIYNQLGEGERHRVSVPGGRDGSGDPKYQWRINASVEVAAPDVESLAEPSNEHQAEEVDPESPTDAWQDSTVTLSPGEESAD